MPRGVAIGAPADDPDAAIMQQLAAIEARLGAAPVGARTGPALRAAAGAPAGGRALGEAEYALYTQLAGMLGKPAHGLFQAAPGAAGAAGTGFERLRAAAGLDAEAVRMVEAAAGDGADLGALTPDQMRAELASGRAHLDPLAEMSLINAVTRVREVVAANLADREVPGALADLRGVHADSRQAKMALAFEVNRRRDELIAAQLAALTMDTGAWLGVLGAQAPDRAALLGVAASLYAHQQSVVGLFTTTSVSAGVTAAGAEIDLSYFAGQAVVDRLAPALGGAPRRPAVELLRRM